MRASTPRSAGFIYLDVYTYYSEGSLGARGRREGSKNKTYTCICSPEFLLPTSGHLSRCTRAAVSIEPRISHFFCNFHHKFVINSTNNNKRNVHLYSPLPPLREKRQLRAMVISVASVLRRVGSIGKRGKL